MDLEARKITFAQEFFKLQSEEIISGLEILFRKQKVELLENNTKLISIEQFNWEIDQLLGDVKNGRITKAKTLKAKIKKWS